MIEGLRLMKWNTPSASIFVAALAENEELIEKVIARKMIFINCH
jgi:hypothetical protein